MQNAHGLLLSCASGGDPQSYRKSLDCFRALLCLSF
jgi:hypothetical protein